MLLFTLKGHTSPVISVVDCTAPGGFKPNCYWRLVASGSLDGTVRVWCLDSGQQLELFNLNSQVVALDSDGEYLAAATRFGTVKLWRIVVSREVRKPPHFIELDEFKLHNRRIRQGGLALVRTSKGFPSVVVAHEFEGIELQQYIADKSHVLAQPDGLLFWETFAGGPRNHALQGVSTKSLLSSGQFLYFLNADSSQIEGWDLARDTLEFLLPCSNLYYFFSYATHHSDPVVYTSHNDNVILLWDKETSTLKAGFKTGSKLAHCMVKASNELLCTANMRERFVSLYRVFPASLKIFSLARFPVSSSTLAMAFCAHDTALVTGHRRGELLVWEVRRYHATRLQLVGS